MCKTSSDYVYFARNMTGWGDRMELICLFEYNIASKNASEICLPPMLVGDIAYIFSPIEGEIKQNDPDRCGFYFFPYDIHRQYGSMFDAVYANSYGIQWHEQSYVANKDKYSDLDYSELIKSTKKQRSYDLRGPYPFATQRDEL